VTNFIIKVLNLTLGRLIRLLQSFKREVQVVNNSDFRVTSEIQKRAVSQSVDYVVENMQSAITCSNRVELWNFCLSQLGNQPQIFLEFGVHTGESIKYLSSKHKFSEVHGFDSFHGLEEDWVGYTLPKGSFNLHGRIPTVTKDINLVAGWFDETLPNFLVSNPQIRTIGLLHMDADTYTPTKYVLKSLNKLINSGTIIIFDEYFGYNNWQSHEFKAFQEFTKEFEVDYTYIAFSDMQVAVQIN
jgi:nucleoid DNA-binding protein